MGKSLWTILHDSDLLQKCFSLQKQCPQATSNIFPTYLLVSRERALEALNNVDLWLLFPSWRTVLIRCVSHFTSFNSLFSDPYHFHWHLNSWNGHCFFLCKFLVHKKAFFWLIPVYQTIFYISWALWGLSTELLVPSYFLTVLRTAVLLESLHASAC